MTGEWETAQPLWTIARKPASMTDAEERLAEWAELVDASLPETSEGASDE